MYFSVCKDTYFVSSQPTISRLWDWEEDWHTCGNINNKNSKKKNQTENILKMDFHGSGMGKGKQRLGSGQWLWDDDLTTRSDALWATEDTTQIPQIPEHMASEQIIPLGGQQPSSSPVPSLHNISTNTMRQNETLMRPCKSKCDCFVVPYF